MISRITTATVYGIDGIKIDVEVDLSYGLAGIQYRGITGNSGKRKQGTGTRGH